MVKTKVNLTGMKFGRLTVIKQVDDYITQKGNHYPQWECMCNCKDGKCIVVRQDLLKRGATQSCGCYQKESSSRVHKKYNDYEIQEDYVIMYTRKGEPFYVDLEDFWRVRDVCWHINKHGYLQGKMNGKMVLLHRMIMNFPENLDVDHRHGEKTKNDNRKENLRIATTSQNTMNSKLRSNNTSGYTGVCWNKKEQKWIAQLQIKRKSLCHKRCNTFEEAVKARKEAEEKYFGEWSYNNSQQAYNSTFDEAVTI